MTKADQVPVERRSKALEFEVPGTPEQVWQAIATGPGISSWLFPTEVEEREGGAIAFHIGPGMESSGSVTAWEPPRRFAYEETDWMENAPPLATEFLIEARSGGTCLVRLVHSLFAAGDEWDDQFKSFETGWPPFFRILSLYLQHFAGEVCAPVRLMRIASGSEAETWEKLTVALGAAGAEPGQRVGAPAGAPAFGGTVEDVRESRPAREMILRLDQPAPGLALLGAHSWGGHCHATISLFFYGDTAAAAAEQVGPHWTAWMEQLFPGLEGGHSDS